MSNLKNYKIEFKLLDGYAYARVLRNVTYEQAQSELLKAIAMMMRKCSVEEIKGDTADLRQSLVEEPIIREGS